VRQRIGTTFDGYDFNEYGTVISKHTCGACGQPYTCCPASPGDDCCGGPPGLGGPDDPGCPSYDPRRDVGAMLDAGTAQIEARPVPERGQA